MKKVISVALAFIMVLTLVQLPMNVHASGLEPLSEAIDSEEKLTLTLYGNYFDEGVNLSLEVTSRDDYQLAQANSSGNVSITFQDIETKQTYTQEMSYYTDDLTSKIHINDNLEKLGFGENRNVIISAIEVNQIKYTNLNEAQFTYSDRIVPHIVSIELDKNNKSVYTETGEYSFIITTDKNYNRWPNANLNVEDGNGHSRNVNMSVEPISDIQYKLTYHIDAQRAIKGQYSFELLNFGDLYIDKDSELYQSLGLDKISFKVDFGSDDFTAPEFVDIKCNLDNGATVTKGDRVIYTVTLKNDEDISLENSSAMISAKYGHSLKLRSIGNHEYTIEFICDEKTVAGDYHLSLLDLCDENGNKNSVDSNAFGNPSFTVVQDSEVTYEELKMTNIKKEPSDLIYLNKDNPEYKITIEFNHTISYTYLTFNCMNSNQTYRVVGDIDGKTATYTIHYNENMIAGSYNIQHLYATNGFQNIYNYGDSDLRNLGFIVQSEDRAYLNSLSFTQNNKQVKPGDKLDFQLDFTKLVNDVNLQFVNKDHPNVRITFDEYDFQALKGTVEGYINDTYGNGVYQLENINFRSNGEYFNLSSYENIWSSLKLDQIQFEIINSHDDFEAPKITSVQIDDSQDFNITSKNDTCSFKITTSELINVNNSNFSISANNSEYLASRIELIDESKCEYLVTIFTTNRSFDGVYSINNFNLRDAHGNENYYYSHQGSDDTNIQKIFGIKVNVSAGITEMNDVKLSHFNYQIQDIYSKNGKVSISLETDQSVSGISMNLENITYARSSYISGEATNNERTKWLFEIDINEMTLNGQYRLERININLNDQSNEIYRSSEEYSEVFEKVKYYVECGRQYERAPKIKKLVADKNNLTNYSSDGKAIFYLTTSADININHSNIQFAIEGYGNKYVNVSYKIEKTADKEYKINCQIDHETFNGNYYIRSINLSGIYDSSNDYNIYDNGRGYYYLSGLGFKVSCGISDLDAPKLLKMYGHSSNKEIYKEAGEYTYYFQFDEDISLNSSQFVLADENDTEHWNNFISLGNHLYAVKLYFGENGQLKNGQYHFSNLQISDKYGNHVGYPNDYENNSTLNVFANELDSIQFKVDLPQEEVEELKIISVTPEDNLVFNEVGDKVIFKAVFNKEVGFSNINFINVAGDYINAYEMSVKPEENGYEYTYGVNITDAKKPGVYHIDEFEVWDDGKPYQVDPSYYSTIQFTNNVECNMPSIDNVSSIKFNGPTELNNIDEKLLVDVTLNKKINNLSLDFEWENINDEYYTDTYSSLINMEEKDGLYIYHYEFNAYNFSPLSQYQLSRIIFEYDNEYCFDIDNQDTHWKLWNLDSVKVKTLYENESHDDVGFNITPVTTNQSIYKETGTYSYIVESDQEFKLTSADIRSYNYNFTIPDVTIKQIDAHKWQIDVEISSNLKNDIYYLRYITYQVDGDEMECSFEPEHCFEVACGIENHVPLKVVNISDIQNEENYNASDNKEISFVVEFNKAIQDIKVYFGNYEDKPYCSEVARLADTKYKVYMSVDETFKTGEYSFLSLKATDEVNESIYLDEYNEFLPDGHLGFNVTNELDQTDSELKIDVVGQKTESNETIERNAWANEKVELNINIQSDNDSKITYLVSQDGKNFEEYNPETAIDNGEHKLYIKAVDENNQESNIVVVNVKVDEERPLSEIVDISPKLRSVIQKVGRKINIKATDELSGVKSVEYKLVAKGQNEANCPYTIGTTATVPANFEGQLIVRVTDNAGNQTVTPYDFERLATLEIHLKGQTDKIVEKDQLSIDLTIDDNDNIQYVGIKRDGNDYEDITSSYKNGYEVTKNGTYTVRVVTQKGAEDEQKIVYNCLDTNPVYLTLIGNNQDKVMSDLLEIVFKNTDIVKKVTIQKDNETPQDITSTYQQKQTIIENGTYTVTVTTTSDQEFTQKITYNNIYVPDMTLKFDIDSNQDEEYLTEDTVSFIISPKNTVVTSLEVYKDDVLVKDIKDSYQDGYKITENGKYEFKLTTSDGQEATKAITYTNIDNSQPEVTLSGNTESTEMKDKLTIHVKADQSGIGLVKIQKNNQAEENITDSYQNGYSIEDNGTYKVVVVTKSGKTASATITYTKLTAPYIHLNETSLRLKPNETFELKAETNIPDAKLIWTTSDDRIVNVDENGNVTAIANGSATIKVECSGYKVEVKCEVVVSDISYMLGDVNRDGEITSADAQLILRYCVGKVELDDEQLILADLNSDGEITSADAQKVLKICVNKE